jgi:hypothetical protein
MCPDQVATLYDKAVMESLIDTLSLHLSAAARRSTTGRGTSSALGSL